MSLPDKLSKAEFMRILRIPLHMRDFCYISMVVCKSVYTLAPFSF